MASCRILRLLRHRFHTWFSKVEVNDKNILAAHFKISSDKLFPIILFYFYFFKKKEW